MRHVLNPLSNRLGQPSRRLPAAGRTLLIQSAGPRATQTDKLTGRGVPTSIGALSV